MDLELFQITLKLAVQGQGNFFCNYIIKYLLTSIKMIDLYIKILSAPNLVEKIWLFKYFGFFLLYTRVL